MLTAFSAWEDLVLFICKANGDCPSFALWHHVALLLWPHLRLFIALHPSFILCLFAQHSIVWKCFLRGCPFACTCRAPSQGIAPGGVREGTGYRAACRTCHAADEKRTMHFFVDFSVPFISCSSRPFTVTDAQLLPCVTLPCWRLCVPLFWRRTPLFISVPIREWGFGEDRLCKSGFQKEELCISERKL